MPGDDKEGAISLDDLIALNDEIAALVRAGVPLERGLLGVRGDLRGRLGGLAAALGERMEKGESLAEAIESQGDRLPSIYKAVVRAGVRAGRLPTALEGLATFARSYAELRRAVGLALLYPVLVLVLAYALFLGFVWKVVPPFVSASVGIGVPATWLMVRLQRLGELLPYWAPVLPALLVVGWLWWVASGRAASLRSAWAWGPLGWLPWMRRMLARTREANFAELLALLVDHGVPLPEALDLAAEATGDPKLGRSARASAESARRGGPPGNSDSPLPPMLAWLLATPAPAGGLVAGLRHAAQTYRRQAMHQAEVVRVFLPTLLLFVIGASATLTYALTLFAPLAEMLNGLASP